VAYVRVKIIDINKLKWFILPNYIEMTHYKVVFGSLYQNYPGWNGSLDGMVLDGMV
jgi:hypothetical protein